MKSFVFLLLAFAIFPFGKEAGAAEFQFDTSTKEAAVGEEFAVTLVLDTEGEWINAMEGNVVFSPEILALKGMHETGSIVDLWIKRPELEKGKDGNLDFSGGTPQGYRGRGTVFSLLFDVVSEGEGSVRVQGARVLLHDGKGTQTHLTSSGFTISAVSRRGAGSEPPGSGDGETGASDDVGESQYIDEDPPEPFGLFIARDPAIFNDAPFLIFVAQDKGSGIDYYEVSLLMGGEKTDWERAESPFLLERFGEIEHVWVKAVDRAGNERISESAVARSFLERVPYAVLIASLLLAVVLLGLVGYWLQRKKK